MADLNRDDSPELITSTKRGTFIFWNYWKISAAAGSSALDNR